MTLNVKDISHRPAGKFRYKYAASDDNDLLFEEWKVEELLDRIEKSVGRAKEDVTALFGTIGANTIPAFNNYVRCEAKSSGNFYGQGK